MKKRFKISNASVKKQVLHGAFWSFAERFGQQGLQFFVSIILARLLEPKDFGVLGMIMIFFALSQTIIDSGFGQALIQKQNANHTDESTVFWFNLVAGLAMAGTLFASAPWIAAFYDTPLLKPITRIYSLNLLINSFGVVQNSLLIKELEFRRRMGAVFSGIIASGAVGIFMAWQGYGVWALVLQGLVMNGVRTAGLWVVHPWRPKFVFSEASFRNLWKFGSNLLFSGLLNAVFENIYLVVIGKIYSPAQLGFYQRGKRLTAMTSQSVSQVVSQVNFPILSRMQDNPEQMRRVFARVLQSTMLIVLPMMSGLAITAPGLILVLLGEKWVPSVPYLQMLSIIGIFYPLHLLNLDVIKSLGRSDIFFRLEIIKRVLVVFNVLINWRHGVMGLLVGQVACSILGLGINAFYTHRFLNFGLVAQLESGKKIWLASFMMGGVIWVLGHTDGPPPICTLFLQVFFGVSIYVGLIWLFRESTIRELCSLALNKMRKE